MGSCLTFPCSLSLFLSPYYIFFGLSLSATQILTSLWVGLCCSTRCGMVNGRKETSLGQARDIPYRQGNRAQSQQLPGVTGYSKLFSMTTQLSCILKSSATATPPLLSTLLSFLLSLSIFIIKSRKSIFTPIVMYWKMNKRIKPFLLC